MYVRWKSRMTTKGRMPTGVRSLSAVLVESHRVNGKPKQKIVAYLGTIHEDKTEYHFRRQAFWESADQTLAGVTNDQQRLAIEMKLLEKVKRPTTESLAEVKQRLGGLV